MTHLVPRGAAAAFAAVAVAVSSLAPAQQWQQANPAAAPAARNSHAMAFDIARGVNVLFGGQTSVGVGVGDHWEWNGTAWTQRALAAAPSARWSHALVYDSRRMRLVLFGGFEPSSWSFRNDTWEFDGVAWTLRATASAPSPRGYSGLAYDSQRGVTVLFGGYDGVGGLGDTWEWDGTAWSQRTPAAAPSPRHRMAMAFDSVRNETVLFGGGVFNNASAETWTWNGTNWTQRTTAAAPSARWDTRMAFDSLRGKAVLHGGADGGYSTDFGDSWEWNGSAWTQLAGTGPSVRHGSAMSYDARKAQVVLFGGRDAGLFLGETWKWDAGSISQNKALRLGPSSSVTFPFHSIMHTGNASTMEYWIRADSPRGLTSWNRVAASAEHKELSIKPDGSINYLYAGSPWHQYPSYGGVTLPGPNTIPSDGQWHHLAFVRRANGSWSIYVDGTRIVNQSPGTGLGNGCWITCGVIQAATQTVLQNQSSSLWSWDIDELRISNSERYAGNFVPSQALVPDANTAMLLHFDEGVGVTVGDAGPAAQLGSFSSQATWTWVPGVAPSGPTATFATYGEGCAHSTNTPLLGALNGSTPRLNQTLAVRLTGLPLPSVFVPMAFLGYRNDTALGMSLPFSMGMYGMPPQCQQYVEPDMGLVFTLQNSGGYADWPIFVPNQPSLLGSPVFLQGLVFDWTLPYPLPAVSTNAAIATIGL